MALLPAAYPAKENQKIMLDLVPNLRGNQFKRAKKAPSVAAIIAIGEAVTGS